MKLDYTTAMGLYIDWMLRGIPKESQTYSRLTELFEIRFYPYRDGDLQLYLKIIRMRKDFYNGRSPISEQASFAEVLLVSAKMIDKAYDFGAYYWCHLFLGHLGLIGHGYVYPTQVKDICYQAIEGMFNEDPDGFGIYGLGTGQLHRDFDSFDSEASMYLYLKGLDDDELEARIRKLGDINGSDIQ